MLYPTSYLKSKGLGKACALVTDGRSSGVTSGLSIEHVSPEAAEGGLIALVETGDPIEIDVPNRLIRPALDHATLDARRQAMVATLTIAAVETGVPTLVEARTLVAGFHEMIRLKAEADLAPWIERGRDSLVASFANGVARDIEAVRAAIVSPWSNGQTEGQITKLKLVKRQMYGRGKLDLLQARLIGPHDADCTKFASEPFFHADPQLASDSSPSSDPIALSQKVGRPIFILEDAVRQRLGLTVAPVIIPQIGQKLELEETQLPLSAERDHHQ